MIPTRYQQKLETALRESQSLLNQVSDSYSRLVCWVRARHQRRSQSLLNQVSDSYIKGESLDHKRERCRNPFLIRSVIPTRQGLEYIIKEAHPSQSLLNQVSDSYCIQLRCLLHRLPSVWSQSLLNQVSDSYLQEENNISGRLRLWSQSLLNQVSDSYQHIQAYKEKRHQGVAIPS